MDQPNPVYARLPPNRRLEAPALSLRQHTLLQPVWLGCRHRLDRRVSRPGGDPPDSHRDEAFDYARDLHDPHTEVGTTRLVLDKPLTGRLPMVHRLDVSLEREFAVSFGKLLVQVGLINAYDRQNMFYYDLFTGRRLDQLPLAPYASVTLRNR